MAGRVSTSWLRAGAAALLWSALLGTASVARSQETFPRGEVVERVRSTSDSTQSYALYLPSEYDPAWRWPILFLMDPRGRALVPLDLFRDAAERRGYILISSYDTMSDGPREPNAIAMQAMLSDVFGQLAVDPQRLHMVGFSGTAREAWEFASRIPDNVAGIIGFGAGLPGTWMDRAMALSEGGVAYFGGAGTTGFNYEEVRELGFALDGTEIPHRLHFFDGGHEWAPRSLCSRAVDWLELQAIRADLRPRDDGWIQDLYAELLEEARSLEASGHLYEASEAYRYLVADFAGLLDVSEPERRAAVLSGSDAVQATEATLDTVAELRREFDDELTVIAAELAWKEELPSVGEARQRLGIDRLQAEARLATDTLRAQGAQRRLENAFVQFAFYSPRSLLQGERPELALAALDIAEAIKPGSPQICWFRARAYAQAGKPSEALDQVACLADAGAAEAVLLEEDLYLEPLRSDPRYRELLERMRAGGP